MTKISKLVQKMRKIVAESNWEDAQRALNYVRDEVEYEDWDSGIREQHFRDTVKELGLTIGDENEHCIYVKEFKELQARHLECPNPYFMFWKASQDDKNRPAHLEFGHWHMNRKWDKQYPTTEYHTGVLYITQQMKNYKRELDLINQGYMDPLNWHSTQPIKL